MSLFGVIRDALNPLFTMTVGSKGEAHVLVEDNVEQIVGGLITQTVTGPLFMTVTPSIGDYTITMAASHGLLAGDFIVLAEDDRLYQGTILSVATNVLTLDTPIPYAFPFTGTVVFEVLNNMNVDGSTTRQTFTIGTPDTVTKNIHYRGLRVVIVDGGAMDDGKFGSISALTRGVVFRLVRDNGDAFNFANVKTNGD